VSVRQDIAEAYAEAFDAEREALFDPDSTLFLILNAGTAEQSELEIEYGWLPERQQKFGEVASVRVVKITERYELTPEVMNQADRLKLNGVLHQFTFDPPIEEPLWFLYATEMKAGGIR
jgi:hypothetical protein